MTTQVTVPEQHIDRLEQIMRTDPRRGIVAAWRVVMRHTGENWQTAKTVNPSEYAINEETWGRLCRAALDHTCGRCSAIGRVNYGLTWMNVGPASFEEGSA